ncbi:MAG: retroviral-like aspartic protease family protein [Chloroflexota bacterium]
MTRAYTFDYDPQHVPSAPFIDIYVYTKSKPEKMQKISLMVDTGADATILPIQLLQQIKAPMTRMGTLTGIHGIRKSTRLYRIALQVGDYTLNRVEVASSEGWSQAVLGRDVLNHLVLTLDGPTGVTILI